MQAKLSLFWDDVQIKYCPNQWYDERCAQFIMAYSHGIKMIPLALFNPAFSFSGLSGKTLQYLFIYLWVSTMGYGLNLIIL
jgi:hypothetical protein